MTLKLPHKPMVLVADDEPIIVELLDAILSGEGYAVLAVASADEAMEMGDAHHGQISLALLDYSLPGASAKLGAYLNGHSEIRIVLMSGYPETNIRSCRTPYEFYEFIQKPFTREMIMSVVHKTLDAPPPSTERAGGA